MAPAQPRCFPSLSPPADMLKDVIREYDEHFPEIIERATYTLEKVGAGIGVAGVALWNTSSREALHPAAFGGPVSVLPALEAWPSLSTWELPLHTSSPPLGSSPSCSWRSPVS